MMKNKKLNSASRFILSFPIYFVFVLFFFYIFVCAEYARTQNAQHKFIRSSVGLNCKALGQTVCVCWIVNPCSDNTAALGEEAPTDAEAHKRCVFIARCLSLNSFQMFSLCCLYRGTEQEPQCQQIHCFALPWMIGHRRRADPSHSPSNMILSNSRLYSF